MQVVIVIEIVIMVMMIVLTIIAVASPGERPPPLATPGPVCGSRAS